MSWEQAMRYAIYVARMTGRRHYVRGYQTSSGRWLYGPYTEPRPSNGRQW